MQSPSEVAPVRGALHQFGEQFVRFTVIIESLRPKMARISHHNFSTLEQQWMVVSRVGRETRFQGHLADSGADGVYFAAIRETETAFPRGQTAKQTYEPRGKKRKVNRRPNRQLPLHDQLPPQKREHDEVSPDSYFQIVPAPRRGFDREKENKDSGRGKNERDLFGESLVPFVATQHDL